MNKLIILAASVSCLVLSSNSCPAQSARQTNAVLNGQVIDHVECLNDSSQSYALYLPSNYTHDRKWPILYAFDPSGRGKTPVERFKDAAEKFGWIVAGSNNSRNGPWPPSVEAWKAISADTHQRFSIDDARMYATGFSGGARVAIGISQLCQDCFAGVIACSAGFPFGLTPSTQMRFLFFGTTGVDDFNFPELKGLDGQLAKAGITHRIAVFDGRHEWPPADVATDALEWMELHAMKLGKRTRDEKLIASSWERMIKQAESLVASKPYPAYQIYLSLAETLKGLRDVTEVESRGGRLRESREVKEAIRDEQMEISKQEEFEAQLNSFIAARRERNGDDANSRRDNRSSGSTDDEETLERESRSHALINKLRVQAKASEDSSTRRIARRALDGVFVALFEQGSGWLQNQKHYREAATTFKLATEINPDRAGAFYYLAWAYAAAGDKKKALQALNAAIDKGFSDLTAIGNNQAFASIRSDAQYQGIIGRLQKK
jgi:predicted esterase